MPGICACCTEPASRSLLLRRRGVAPLIVPYCAACHAHAAAFGTRTLAVALATSLLGLTLALSGPLLWPWLSLGAAWPLVILASSFPLLLALAWRRRRRPGHAAAWRAAWWVGRRKLFCGGAGELRPARRREPALSGWMAIGPVLAALLAPFVHRLHHPFVRVVNLSADRVAVIVDGRLVAWVAPTTAESPAAGAELRLPAGLRRLEARDAAGRTLQASAVKLVGGASHLYAPASDGYCFWLERTRYGRATNTPSDIVPLVGDQRFWVLTDPIHSWFSPNPPPADETRSTGGSLTALRQAPCTAAPFGAGP
jgi:hypothetical protein